MHGSDSMEECIGVMMLETVFPRLPGDIGNPQTFPGRVIYEVVQGASPEAVVCRQSKSLLEPFVEAGRKLIERGATKLTTSCGFLILFQEELEDALDVRVVTSSLLALAELEEIFGRNRVGVLTISRSSFGPDMRSAAGVTSQTPLGSTEGGVEFTRAILENRTDFDARLCEKDNVEAALALVRNFPRTRAILLECTNMPPHATAISEAAGLPVYSILDLLR